jgi:SAM-dependent methyltransferase
VGTLHRYGYRWAIYSMLSSLLLPRQPFADALDFGSGDGWFAFQLAQDRVVEKVVPVDVQARRQCYMPPLLYSGTRLPFHDLAFDLVYCIDVLHHCEDPLATLRELLRCCRTYCVIKDHTYRSRLDHLWLCVMDEIGNRIHGVHSPYHYQRGWEWFPHVQAAGFVLEELIYPAPCHPKPLGWLTDHVQFIALWRRESSAVRVQSHS